jgi:type IV pilus assembly protein PilB
VTDYVSMLNERLERLSIKQGIAVPESLPAKNTLLTDVLMAAGIIDCSLANNMLENASGCQTLDPTLIAFAQEFIDNMRLLIPGKVMFDRAVFPIKHEGNQVHLVMSNPLDEGCVAELESWTGSGITRYSCNSRNILHELARYFPKDECAPATDVETAIENANRAISHLRHEKKDKTAELYNNPYVIHVIKNILEKAVGLGASDIHFEPQKGSFRVRARLDGVLQTLYLTDSVLKEGLLPRIKMISGMNIAVINTPQDGRINYHIIAEREIDIRVSVLPSIFGEKAVLRILDKSKNRLRFSELTVADKQKAVLVEAIRRPNGLILVTGPTGSGKTTTLYSFLEELNTEGVNISTAEDPVEYELPGITQVNCNDEALSFSTILRSFLRQDPDIIMVGEIRDFPTADMAVKAALTGHLVFSTLHTNDAPGTITRLVNLGVPPFLLASCGLTVIAQRLIRTICKNCKQPYIPTAGEIAALGLDGEHGPLFKGTGCEVCSGTGYKGRMSLMEILTVNNEIERLILEQRPVGEIKHAAIANGMTTLRDDALSKLMEGVTTPEEILRVTLDS